MSVLNRTALAAALLAAAPLAFAAGSDTATMQVSIDIVNSCTITATDMAFPQENVESVATATATLTVDCTASDDDFTIALDGGGSGDTSARRMDGPGTATIDYQLYSDSAYGTVWGNTTGQTVGGTSTGGLQPYTVYGEILAQGAKPVGTYTDSITATVTF